MSKRVIDLRTQRPLLDVASFGRRGPEAKLTADEVAYVARTARRVPEVMIKVSGGARSLQGVAAHFDYIGRKGLGEIETDMGERLNERGFEKNLVLDWDLDLDVHRLHTNRAVAYGRRPPKLVHNLIFSMPKGTPSDKLAAAVRTFAVNRFALQHRYAMALHTHQGNPHVHLVVKAVSEQGVRLNIRKATLRDWRQQFATCLRQQGIEANATERAVRGEIRTRKTDGIYRSEQRGASTHMRARMDAAAQRIRSGRGESEPGRSTLIATRRQVERGWYAVHDLLERDGHAELARDIRRFVAQMPPARTEREQIAEALSAGLSSGRKNHDPRTR
jgi:hypothetical protein